MVDVLDRDGARLDAGAARDAVPDHLLGHAVADDRLRALGEELVANAHDHELGGEDLAGRVRGAGVLAAPALRAREGVDDLLAGQVGDRRDAEAQLVVGQVEAQWLEPSSRARAREPDVERCGGDVEVLRARDVPEEAEDEGEVRPEEDAIGVRVPRERVRHRPGQRAGGGVEADCVRRRVPEEQRRHDAGDHEEDEVGLAEMRAAEPLGPDRFPDHDGGRHPDEHEHAEDVREPTEPLLPAEPWQLRAPVDGGDHRHQDRRQQDEEPPEDEGVHQAGDEPAQQLPLPEHDLELRAGLAGRVQAAVVRNRSRDEAVEEDAPPPRAHAGDHHQRDEGDCAYERTFRSSALMAGTTSCRSPITA